MKIVMVLHSHICGGAEKHALSMMSGLQSRGHQVAFAGPADSWLAENARKCGIRCFDVALTGYFDLLSLLRLCRTIGSFGADIVHGHLTRGAYYAGLAARLTGRISVATAHLMNSHKRFHLAKRVIAVSDSVRDYLIAHRCRPDQITVIRNGIEMPRLEEPTRALTRRDLGIGGDEIALCMVSRLAQFKGHELVFDALSRLANPRLHLFVIGETNGVVWYDVLRDRAQALGISGQIHFLGYRQEISPLLAAMDIFVSASQREAFPTSVLEACASGLPVVASRVGGTGEIIRPGENGLLFESGDADTLATRIADLAANPVLRARLGRQAQEDALQHHSVECMISSTIQLYHSELHQRCP